MPTLGVLRVDDPTAERLAGLSAASLDRPLRADAELATSVASSSGRLLGAFGRSAVAGALRRGSGGAEVVVAPGTVHVLLALSHPSALVEGGEGKLVNRHVRPLLRALTAAGRVARHFGRDWVSAGGAPVAWVGFAHDAGSGRATFEAVIGVAVPFAAPGRASFLGKAPAPLGGDPEALAAAIVEAYARGVGQVALPCPALTPAPALDAEPPWAATREEAIGSLGAGRDAAGRLRLGGDLLASRDAIARLERGALGCASADALGALVDATLGAPGVAVDGIRALTSVRDVLAEALGLPVG